MTDHGLPGRSLFTEMSALREEMEALRKAMGMLIELQRELNVRITTAEVGLEKKP